MGGIIDKILDLIKDILRGWVVTNLENMFTDINDKVGTIATEVAKTPSTWNADIFDIIKELSNTVMVPIAGIIISAILTFELISMIMDKNSMRDFDTSLFIRYLGKACIAVMLLSKTFDITMAIFDLGNHIVTQAATVIGSSTSLDVKDTLLTMFNTELATMEIPELMQLAIETLIVSLLMEVISVVITIVLYGRMMEIYIYISVAPVPFSTLGNREWGTIGTNYIRALAALAFQGFLIMVYVGIYAALVSALSVSGTLHTALWTIVAYTVLLCFSLLKTGQVSKNILNAH